MCDVRNDERSHAVQSRVLERVGAALPALVDNPDARADLESNFSTILAEAATRYDDRSDNDVLIDQTDALLRDEHLASGALHADRLHHPADALLAAEIIFDECLPWFIDAVGADDSASVVRAARALHSAIWARFPAGAVAYTEALRQRVTTAHVDSRARLARDLHDRIAHGVVAGVQRVEIALYTATDTAISPGLRAQLDDAVTILRTSLADIQSVAVELHARVGEATIEHAIERHVADLVGMDEGCTVRSSGERFDIAGWQAEEALTIVLEAVQNCRKHATDPTSIDVEVRWSPDTMVIAVSDSGPGFDPTVMARGRLGQTTMRERASLIGGLLTVRSAPGSGSTVSLELPRGRS